MALSLQGVASISPCVLSCFFFFFYIDLALDVDFMFGVQVATHLKGLAEKAKLNEKHVKIARIYKARAASLTSERTELQERAQRVTEEVERLKSYLKHTTSARARAESREDEARSSLTAVEGELREAQSMLRVAQNDLAKARDELQTARDELISSRGELRESREELRAANDELRNKVALLDGARREASEAANLAKRLDEECGGLRGDLHRQITLVAQRDEIIGRLREQASAQWASRWLSFQQKAANMYPGLDFNFDLPSDKEAEESFSANFSQEPGTPAEANFPSSLSVPPADA